MTEHTEQTDNILSFAIGKIRQLNDELRRTGVGGQRHITPRISALSLASRQALYQQMRDYTFTDDGNDPYHQHDFGSITVKGDSLNIR